MVSPVLSPAAVTEVLVKGLRLTRSPHFRFPLEMQVVCVGAGEVLEGVGAAPRADREMLCGETRPGGLRGCWATMKATE